MSWGHGDIGGGGGGGRGEIFRLILGWKRITLASIESE